MNNLLTPSEVESTIIQVRAQKFASDRKNTPPWCMQWISLAFAICFFVLWYLRGQWQITPHFFLATVWIGVAAMSNVQWKLYKERFVLRQILDKYQGEQPGPGYPPQGVGSPDP